ncbi:integrase [Herbaspirillum lusitanum]|uniref:tyrosine-type recombinase/integrase n=1 Tax=Herbaspirillum lusitanum TaxID=213312 RepID=UPI0022371BD3|nr:tyrosine-type recombinase/integrase [Herbaspirillum lusitanum]MCW5297285.1 integrase [Herbaspirillum lusitanum]
MLSSQATGIKLISLAKIQGLTSEDLIRIADVERYQFSSLRKFQNLMLYVLVGRDGTPIWTATRFLIYVAIVNKGYTADTQRTYGESLVSWFRFLADSSVDADRADEEILQLYRSSQNHGLTESGEPISSATVNLRVTVVKQFYNWCQRHGEVSSLGRFLTERKCPRVFSVRVVKRHPKVLSGEEISCLFKYVKDPYRLAFRWAIATGMRRMEVASLRRTDLPSPETVAFNESGLIDMVIRRKGGKEVSVYVPVPLIEETQWYLFSIRPKPAEEKFSDFIFLNRDGRPISKWSMSNKFRKAADSIGSKATLHHLRHTYATNVLRFLENESADSSEEKINSLKTLQMLLGHSNSATTEIYLSSMKITSPTVVAALDYLYGASL